jgi:hypothetical protein
MRKIPTVFRRDPDDMRRVLPEVTPGCEWVLAGEGVATRKYDGTCVMFDGERWWARREVKRGKPTPQVFQLVDTDPATGKSVGWEPIENSPFARWHAEALDGLVGGASGGAGTYELCGPKVQGDPERFGEHVLIAHAGAEEIAEFTKPLDFDLVRATALHLGSLGVEGIVWHHPDGRMAKIKARDFPGPRSGR